MSINPIQAAVADLETKMANLDSTKHWFGSNSIFAKWRNGRAARSAVHLNNLLEKLDTSNNKDKETLQAICAQALKLFGKFNQLRSSEEFSRTTYCVPRASNTQRCLAIALNSLRNGLLYACLLPENNGVVSTTAGPNYFRDSD